ncbi:hypothetical protein MKW98_012368 [Papaver atlanticum]|uniref:MADS-box domain-containing protein n=1 Tax=Papaver atlanticum TaxID=357466 RepID=A0AAD4T1Q5_9MAGN|nr:hypothetical protein MKW98_012368 [Papaver atlanticum]
MKKVSELSTLCGVSACAIVYGPCDRTPEVWPQQPEAHRVLMRFKSLPEMDQIKKQLNQESFTYNRIGNIIEQFKKQKRENRYMDISEMYNHAVAGKFSISNVHPSDLGDLAWVLDDKKKAVQRKLSELKKSPKSVLQTTPANTSSAIFTTPTTSDANTIATPNPSTSVIHTNVNVGGSNGSGINGVTMAGGTGMYEGVINRGTGEQERMTPDHTRQAMEAL